jgi:hypothetical protein
MKITTVNKFLNNEIKTNNKYKFPTYEISGTNNFYFGLIGGVRGAGKSSAMINLLEIERKNFLVGENKVYYISPTKDDKIQMMIDKYPNNFIYIDELTINNIKDTLNVIKNNIDEWIYKKELLENKADLDENDEEIIKYIDNIDINLNHPPISTICIDDSMSSPLISSAQNKDGKNFIKFALKHRHYPHFSHLFIISQHIKSISKPLRVQCNIILMFPFRDYNVYKTIFDEYSGLFDNKIDNFINIMKKIETENKNNFLLIFYDSKKFIRIGFNRQIQL